MSDVTVSVPARPDFVHVLRSVVASVAARADFSYDAIEDLRLAVDEACAQLLAIRAPATSLTLAIGAVDTEGLEIVASIDATEPAWPPAGAERTLTWQVLSSLADEARLASLEGRPAFVLRKRRTPARADG